MRLSFLSFHPASGFVDSWPMERMAQVMGQLAQDNPTSTVDDAPGVVAFLWPKAAPAATLRVTRGRHGLVEEVSVTSNEVLWLQKDSSVAAQRSNGDWEGRQVNAQGEVRPMKAARPRRRSP